MDQENKIQKYCDAADPHMNWSKGNRHLSLVSLACNANKAGFDENVVISECTRRYAEPDFDDKEIRETISDVYKRYSSDHGSNQKAFSPKTDKKTKGQIDTSTETDDDFLSEEDILCTPCPDISKAKKYIDDNIYGWVIDPQSGQVIQMAAFLALVAAMGATMKDVKCLLRKAEVVGTNLYFILTGAAASGKSCIEPSRDFFRAYAKDVENKSREEVKQQTQAHKAWEKCNKRCEEEDCGCGAEPVVPPLKDIDLSLNTTASRLITQLVNNGDIPTLLSTSELAANMDMKDAPLSPLLRMAHAGETISYNTQKYGNIKIYNTKLTIIGAGTPEQVVGVIKNKEDGLASRSFFICLPDTPYKALYTDDDFDFDEYEAKEEAFEKRALTFAHYAANVKINFKLTKKSQKYIDIYFIEAEKSFAKYASDALYSFLRRLRSGDVIIAQILATSYFYINLKGSGTYEIPDEIIELVISWNDYFIEQHIRVLNMLPDPQVNKDSNELKHPELLKKLPCDFTCREAWEIAKPIIDISERNLRRVINKWKDKNIITKKGKTFHKVDCQEPLPKA